MDIACTCLDYRLRSAIFFMSIRYITTCDNCKTSFSFETGLAYMPFFNSIKQYACFIDSLGNKDYRSELKEYLKQDKDFYSPIDKRCYGCPKCHLVYNIEILENFKSDYAFLCKKCNEKLINLSLKIVSKKGTNYINFYESNNTDFYFICEKCKKKLLGLIDFEIDVD